MKKWFVVYTKVNQELKVSDQLTDLGIKNYCPSVTLVKQYSDRKKKIKKPMMPSYLMINLDEKNRNDVFIAPGIVRYLFFNGKPAEIREDEINQMKSKLKGIYNEFNVTSLRKGQEYNINEGPFSGLNGKVIEIDRNKVKLEIHSLGLLITFRKEAA